MRIEFLTQDDPLYILPFFEEFLRSHSSEFEILRISCSSIMGKRSRVQMVRELTALYGPFGVARLVSRVAGSRALSKFPIKTDGPPFPALSPIPQAHALTLLQNRI